jgi:hypothetical protein
MQMNTEKRARCFVRSVCSLTAIACLSALSLLPVGCGGQSSSNITSDGQPGSTTSPNDKAPSAGAAGQTSITCKDVFGRIKGDEPGNKGNFPADFPEPPPGSTLCGTVGANIGGHAVFLNATLSDDEILKYYKDALGALGYTLDKVSQESGGNQRLDFERPGIANGWVSVTGDKDRLGLKYKDVFRVAYNTLK